jgi:nucleoside-diphosphate-sugar epimerase
LVVVAGGGGSSAGTSWPACASRVHADPQRGREAPGRLVPALRRRRQPPARPARSDDCDRAVDGASEVYNLAADMGGMGFIENNKALCMLSVLINTHLLMASREAGVEKFFFARRRACTRGQAAHDRARRRAARGGRLSRDARGRLRLGEAVQRADVPHFREDFGMHTRMARYHNIYGPHGTWDGGREKAPAAICRKVIQAKLSGKHEIEIWGDGEQTRSFTYIDDCLEGTQRLMHGDVTEALNVGSDQMVSINQLVDIVEKIAGVKAAPQVQPVAPKGVRGRNSNNERIQELLGWAPASGSRTAWRRPTPGSTTRSSAARCRRAY